MEQTQPTTVESTKTRIELSVSEDRLAVLLSCPAGDRGESDLVEEIQTQLETMGIKGELDAERLSRARDRVKQGGGDIVDLVVAKGRPPVMPRDGRLEWTRDFFSEGYYVDPETKKIDYRRKAATPDVKEGELLVKVHPPQSGVEGCDVFGQKIRVRKPKKVKLRAGPNVVWSEEDSGYRASCSGRVMLSGTTLDVEDIIRIAGDLGSDTGNIRHKGHVVVAGDVVSLFGIEASGDIEVKGVIGACDIICGGSLIAKGGIRGSVEKLIKVRNSVSSKYIENATIESGGDIHSDLEILQSVIRASGRVDAEGRVIGGTIIAAKGIRVGHVGSKENTKTTLVAGVDCRVLESIKVNSKSKDDTKKTLKNLALEQKKIEAIASHLTKAQREAFTEVQFMVMEAQEKTKELEEEGKELRKLIYANRGAQIEISGHAFAGTILRVLDSQYEVEETLKGPLVAAIDSATGKVSLSSTTLGETE